MMTVKDEQAMMSDPERANDLAGRLLRLLPRLQQWAFSPSMTN